MQTFKFYLLVILFFNNFKCGLLSSLPFSLPSYKHILFSLQILFPSHIHVIVCVWLNQNYQCDYRFTTSYWRIVSKSVSTQLKMHSMVLMKFYVKMNGNLLSLWQEIKRITKYDNFLQIYQQWQKFH